MPEPQSETVLPSPTPTDILSHSALSFDPSISFATTTAVGYNEEFFILGVTSGNAVSRFAYSPEHMKRLLLVLQEKIPQYEERFREIKTELPKQDADAKPE